MKTRDIFLPKTESGAESRMDNYTTRGTESPDFTGVSDCKVSKGIVVPNQALYQAELRPVSQSQLSSIARVTSKRSETPQLSGLSSNGPILRDNPDRTGDGHDTPRTSSGGVESGAESRICQFCGNPFHRPRRTITKNNSLKFCSRDCANKSQRGKPITANLTMVTPDSTKAERIRANGLVNQRIKLGHFSRPTECDLCGKTGRTDAHHPDYSQPDLVAFLCRSCHMKAHRNREVEAQAASTARLARKGPSPHPQTSEVTNG